VKNIKVVRNEKNLGFLLNCNNAVKFAKGKYIHLLNNDTQVQERWLISLIELIESNDNIGMVGSKLVYPDGRQQEAGGIIWNDASGWNFGRLDDPTKPEYNYVKEVDYISGASIMLSKKLWDKIGGFDERYVPAYFEDSDLAFEVRKHGYNVMFQPKSVVVHFEGISHGTDTGTGIKAYQVKNREKFIEKWKNELEKNHFPNAENVFLARDRSRNKKHILIIDHYVPHFDQDAGSRTVFANYLSTNSHIIFQFLVFLTLLYTADEEKNYHQ
jgi:GT2 family glycosyltransferase